MAMILNGVHQLWITIGLTIGISVLMYRLLCSLICKSGPSTSYWKI